MPRNFQLTWHKPRKCWKKHHDGRTYYLGKGRCGGKSDLEGYEVALAEWQAILEHLRPRQTGQQARHAIGLPETAGPLATAAPFATDYKSVDYRPPMASRTAVGETRLSKLAEMFLHKHRQRAETGEVSAKTFEQYRQKLQDFMGYAGTLGRSEASEIDAALLESYRESQLHLTKRTDRHAVSPSTVKQRLQILRSFVQWLYELEVLDRLPRNLNGHYARITLPSPDPRPYTLAEVRTLFNAASQRTKLYIALALNCGYTQWDIASLGHEHIDWEKGDIRRNRHKTDVPQVHKLWPITKDLLRREMSPAGSGLVLLDENGRALKREEIKTNDKLKENDVIRLAFDRVMTKAKMGSDKRRFKTFRKTSSDEIERAFPEYPHLASQFLAHAETATKRFYVTRHYELLFQAIDHLDRHFALAI